MKSLLLVFVSVLSTFATPERRVGRPFQDSTRYYYSGKKKIYINSIAGSNLYSIGFRNDSTSEATQRSLFAIRTMAGVESLSWHNRNHATVALSGAGFNSSEFFRLQRNVVEGDSNIKYVNPVYYPVNSQAQVNPNAALLLTDEIIVKFKPNTNPEAVMEFKKSYGLKTIDSTLDFTVYEVPKFTDALTVANAAQEKQPIVEYAQPNFIIRLNSHQMPNDPYFSNQFYLNNTVQAGADISILGAWSITKGNPNIVIAILDQGVSDPHPDLPDGRQVRLPGSNYSGGNPDDPSPSGNINHGNACAGIVAAEHNLEGIAGIAPLCKIMPIRIPIDFSSTGIAQIAEAINLAWRSGASVISCSWGSNFSDPDQFHPITSAIDSAVTGGRGRLGCVVVFSAGDNAIQSIGNVGHIFFPDNVKIPFVFTVGASDRNNQQSNYSPSTALANGNNEKIDVVAPSSAKLSIGEVWTIDIPGDSGDNPDKTLGDTLPKTGTNYLAYMGRFGGTSASCPEVAGVGALLLSVNPKLTAQQVYNTIITNADRVGGYTYTNNLSVELGYGKINAARAVAAIARQNR